MGVATIATIPHPALRATLPARGRGRQIATLMPDTRAHVITLARDWLGTPYHHQASLRGVGTDCVGLIRGIYREFHGSEAQALPAYTRDWAEGSGRETLLEAARRHLVEIAPFEAQPGDVLVFRWRRNTLAKHCAILSKPTAMIHALEGAPVTEVALTSWWRRHIAGAFVFPNVSPRAAENACWFRETMVSPLDQSGPFAIE